MRHLWQLKTVVFLHWCLIYAILLAECHSAQCHGAIETVPVPVIDILELSEISVMPTCLVKMSSHPQKSNIVQTNKMSRFVRTK